MQADKELLPVKELYVPFGQGVQAELLYERLYVPLSQRVHTVDAVLPVKGLYVPG